MIFRVCEHYDDDKYIYSGHNMPDECFVCCEIRTDLEPYPISLKYQFKYYKQCRCDGWIHKQCLDLWYKKQHKCPVCRLEIKENTDAIYSIVSVVPYSNKIYIFLYKSLCKIANILLYYILIYSIIEFHLNIILHKQNNRQGTEELN